MTYNHRLIIALALSIMILMGWQYFFVTPTIEAQRVESNSIENTRITDLKEKVVHEVLPKPSVISAGFEKNQRITIDSPTIHGSVNLLGGRIDDVVLKKYHETPSDDSPEVTLFAPSNTTEVFFVEFGWINNGQGSVDLPNKNTLWQSENTELSPKEPLKIFWINNQGVKFSVLFSLDDQYMLHIHQSVENNTNTPISLHPYFAINRAFPGYQNSNMLMHEGAIGVLNGKLREVTFSDIKDDEESIYKNQKGWLGLVDKYWLAAIIPDNDYNFNAKISSFKYADLDRFQIDGVGDAQIIMQNQSASVCYHLFAGPKQLKLLEQYESLYKIELFDRAVDFGILYFITKPIFILLSYFYQLLGNFGYAILLLTVCIKLLLFPLSYKSFVSMNKLKVLQPQMAKIKERYADDMQGMQKAMIELYKKEGANPMSGCLPIIIQMPIFFALYKVLYITIEMRHAPFMLWIHDLSAPDPTSMFNLFGLIPWAPPAFLMIGVLPLLMALTMHIQQRLNPEPSDPVQAKVMKLLPLLFLFMFSSFPSGLVLYWAWSNVLSIVQQILIKRLHN